ncbi:uncharacterized protein F5Z01DRAFT_258597 [Emericellopsis atlantica]|uniref:Uncharacterized protein n=1 Tax=Emericellopsis atlantica TaxID=2614577 RepID=A0A9P7ZH16_9HYPO|nr:uncharacterized protein F5Z01DRAFT_258597 [Emericellopsis atlantica]KAG9251949.1 hypothetical protein F5Z01DRAFT_258597 [Emericellopsis atlantica]
MAKAKQKQRADNRSSRVPKSHSETARAPTTTALTSTTAIASDLTLRYKLLVLLHDFLKFTKDPAAERRINSTTDEHYISLPYFSQDEVAMVKSAVVETKISEHALGGMLEHINNDDDNDTTQPADEERTSSCSVFEAFEDKTFDSVVRSLLSNFIDKRRASGDARPCGPHQLAPLYASLFGIDLKETQDERFLGRLRRAGV